MCPFGFDHRATWRCYVVFLAALALELPYWRPWFNFWAWIILKAEK